MTTTFTRPTTSRGTYPNHEAALADLAVRDLKPGVDVHCERDWPARGTWNRYAGRAGRVASINIQQFPQPDGRVYVEVAVRFNESKAMGPTWFLPEELRRGYGAYKPPRSRSEPPAGRNPIDSR